MTTGVLDILVTPRYQQQHAEASLAQRTEWQPKRAARNRAGGARDVPGARQGNC